MRSIPALIPALALSLALALPASAAEPAGAPQEKPAMYPRAEKPAPNPLRELGDGILAAALSVVTVPLRVAATVALTPVYHFLYLTDAEEGRPRASAFRDKALYGDYAVEPEHIRREKRYRFFGNSPP